MIEEPGYLEDKNKDLFGRALIRNPEILILDEATSSIDDETEKLILSSINKLKIIWR